MATKKRKCPDCGAKLKKAEKKGTKQCPDCLLFIDKDDSIIRYQGEADAGTEGNSPEDQDSISQGEQTKAGTEADKSEPVPQPGKHPQPKEGGDILHTQPDPDHISRGLMAHPAVTVYAWPIGNQGNRGYRYGINCPYPNPPWKKKMSGLEAFKFLSNIKNRNRRKQLESFSLPEKEKS